MPEFVFTPGAYIKARRCAAGLSLADVAVLLPTDPATPEHLRIQHLELIEADVQPMTLETVAALQSAFRLDVEVLVRLAAIAQGRELNPPRLCRICGWGTVPDNLAWPFLQLCRPCYEAQSPEQIAAAIDDAAYRPAAA